MEFEPLERDEFEQELRQALERRPAPPGLKRRLMARRTVTAPRPQQLVRSVWLRLAASLILAGAMAGGFAWRHSEEQRKGEEARRQVLTALRITGHALNQIQTRLAEHGREGSVR